MSTVFDNLPPDALRDYEIESEEHLSNARETLLELSSLPDLASVGQQPLDALFRAFHSIKGLSGMVGASSIEQVAHQLEACLSAVRERQRPLTEQAIDLLFEGVTFLEVACSKFVQGEKPPDASILIDKTLSQYSSPKGQTISTAPVASQPESERHREKWSRLQAAIDQEKRLWKVAFSPSSELAARGININSVREKLSTAGEIVDAQPVPMPGGIKFQFTLATDPVQELTGWTEEGITIEPFVMPTGGGEQRPSTPALPSRTTNLVRVDLSRLDDLMRSVTELVISRGRLQGGLQRAARHLPAGVRRELQETTETIEQQLRQLREEIMRVRMVPIRDLFSRMRLVVRDLTRQSGKQINLTFEGEETEVDKLLIERLADPLLHLIRNAVSHGIESPAERQSAGKPPEGAITVRAKAEGGLVHLEVEDDGRGVQTDEVYARAKARGLVAPTAAADSAAVLDILCLPGFSTRETADRESGRGVGMDIVRLAVESLGGTLSLDSQPGRGSRFVCQMPLTLMVADVLIITSNNQTYAVAQTAIREVVPIATDALTESEHHELVHYRDGVLPLLRLSDLFGSARPSGEFVALIAGEGTSAIALAVDRAVGLEEVVVRALIDPLIQVSGISGATDLGDGKPVLILDPLGLVRLARRRSGALERVQS